MRATATAVVPAPVEKVWEALADHEGMASWGPGMKVALATEGSAERNGVGAVRRISAPGPGPTVVEEITRFEPGRALGYKALSGVPFKNYAGEVELTPAGDGTRIAWTITADQRVPLAERLAITAVANALLRLLVRAVR